MDGPMDDSTSGYGAPNSSSRMSPNHASNTSTSRSATGTRWGQSSVTRQPAGEVMLHRPAPTGAPMA